MKKTLFDYLDYKLYLNERIDNSPSKGRGIKLKIAEYLNCQSAFVSQVLNGIPHFSLEQGVKLNSFLGHTKEESRFFLLLLQLERAGTNELRDYFMEEIKDILSKRSEIKNRIDIKKSLKPVDQQIYYSSWYYGAIHMLLSIKEFQTAEKIIERLHLSREKVTEILNFLQDTGLAVKKGEHYEIGVTRIHLNKDSPQIQRHHTNWRLRAIDSIDLNLNQDLHYSSLVSMSRKDVPVVREILLKAIEDCRKVIKESKEEEIQAICIDFFKG
ncbi:TIGR02147 family protein [Peredibacter starrii]|uniref:TIGR02147 family protein n=1 Tax=Peredibacter starrii TaxID=28202 RepID=A0AAX4HL78_9BACT|nr:TIGR02147 family protein [Peredibacter starrii]WPU63994.1 TIGR02147 family protein [Peredibacter starrii]